MRCGAQSKSNQGAPGFRRLWSRRCRGIINAYVTRGVVFHIVVFNLIVAALALIIGAQGAWGKPPGLEPGGKPSARILLFGDSIAAGYGLPEAEGLPARLQAALRKSGHDVEVLNGGVSGDTTAGGLARLDWMLGEKPDIVIVELGGNDGLRGLDPKETYANLEKILATLKAAKVKVLLTGMRAPPNLGAEYDREFDAIYPALAKTCDCLFYPFVLDDVAARPELNQGDGIHPNARGVAVIVERLVPYIVKLLAG